MSAKNIYDVDESKVKIEGKAWDDDLVAALATKKVLQFQKSVEYWRPLLERGRRFENYFEGKIFTPEQREQYHHLKMIPIEPPVAKAPVRALIGACMQSRKSGQVVTERGSAAEAGDNSAELETVNVVLKDLEIKTSEEFRIREALTSAFVSCYPNVLLFDKDLPSRNANGARYKMTALPWNACTFGPPTAREPDGSDIKELFFFDFRTIADLIDNYPDMKEQILNHHDAKDHIDNKLLSSLSQWEGGTTAEERDTLYDVVKNAFEAKRGDTGMVQVVEHLYPIKQKQDVWVNIFDDSGETFEIRPPDWDDERWGRWVAENSQTYAGPYEREVITLWLTVFTTSGLVLANRPHWYQENGQIPASFWVGAISANQPTGPMADMANAVLANAVAETEFLDDLRKGSGRLIIAREGAVKNVEDLPTEMNQSVGLAVLSESAGPMGEAIQEMVRRPNDHWDTYAKECRASMLEITRVNEAMLGQHAPRQSQVAKESEIAQSLTVNATYVDNLNRCWEYHQNLKLKLIPYFYNIHEVIEVRGDKSGEILSVEVNAPGGYDMMGNVTSVINDLSSHRWRFKISPVDDSPTAKARAQEDAINIINSAAGPLLSADTSGTLFSVFLGGLDNTVLKDMGKRLGEIAAAQQQAAAQTEQQAAAIDQVIKLAKAKADMIRSMKHGTLTTWSAETLADYPQLQTLWLQLQQMFDQKADAEMAEIQQLTAPQQQAQLPMPGGTPPGAIDGGVV